MATQNLSSLLRTGTSTNVPVKNQKLAVFNADRDISAVTNGGQCCCFIVPASVSFLTFEMWGAGGDGAGACCCMGPAISASAGQYAIKTISGSLCPYYIICASTSGSCRMACGGCCGAPSFVLNSAATLVACASGGQPGASVCWSGLGCTSCNGMFYSSQLPASCYNTYADMVFPSQTMNTMNGYFCAQYTKEFQVGVPKFQPNTRHSSDPCSGSTTWVGCCKYFSTEYWPGGAGATGAACGGPQCWGGWGNSGLVLITYG